jgi:MFS family permease
MQENFVAPVSLKLTLRRAGALQGVLLILPITMAVMGLAVLSPVLPTMQAHFQNQPGVEVLVPLALTLPALCVALLSPVAGFVVDWFGRRKALLGALVLYAAVGTLPLFLDSLIAIVVSRGFLGVTEAVIVIASTTLIGDYFQDAEREKWLANQTAVASISAIFLFAIGGALGNLGWRAPFAVYSVSLLYVIGLLLWTWESRLSEAHSLPLGHDDPDLAAGYFRRNHVFYDDDSAELFADGPLRDQRAEHHWPVYSSRQPVRARGDARLSAHCETRGCATATDCFRSHRHDFRTHESRIDADTVARLSHR